MTVSRARLTRTLYVPPAPQLVTPREPEIRAPTMRDEPGWVFAVILSLCASPVFGFLALRLWRLSLFYLFHAVGMILIILLLKFMDFEILSDMPYWFAYVVIVNLAGSLHLLHHPGPSVPSSRWLVYILTGMVLAFCALAGVILLNASFPSERMNGAAMTPTVPSGAAYTVRPFDADTDTLNRGDLVLFTGRGPDNTPVHRMARIIGLPGDTLAMFRGFPLLNGKPLQRIKLPSCGTRPEMKTKGPCYLERLESGNTYSILKTDADGAGPFDNRPPRTVPSGHYYVLSDNRDVVRDSRDMMNVGMPAATDIIGFIVPLQITPAGRYELQTWENTLADSYERLRTRIFGERVPPRPQQTCTPWGRLSEKPWRKCTPGASATRE